MILRAASPVIRAPVQRLFTFFEQMDRNYLRWHPDHAAFRWIDEAALKTGVRFSFEEKIAGKLLRKTVKFTRIVPGTSIEFAPVSRVFALFLPRITFAVAEANDGFVVTQEIVVRTGPVGAWLNRREFDAVRAHMREEGENLRRLLEA